MDKITIFAYKKFSIKVTKPELIVLCSVLVLGWIVGIVSSISYYSANYKCWSNEAIRNEPIFSDDFIEKIKKGIYD